MQVLIIEDEARAANQLQRLLRTSGFEYELLGILDSVEDSVQWFQKNTAPDIVFMDIQLADGLSFEIFQHIEIQSPIIFTTAFDQYAIKAFKVNSVDYLLKPIQEEDLQQAMDKFLRSNKSPVLDTELLKNLLAQAKKPERRQGILVKEGDGFMQVRTEDLLYIYSEESLSFGVTSNKRVIIDETIDQLFPSLDPSQFFRINRGQIVAKSAILKIAKYFNHRLKLSMVQSRDLEFIVSRQKVNDFKHWMNQ